MKNNSAPDHRIVSLVALMGMLVTPQALPVAEAAVGPVASSCTGATVNPGTDNLQAIINAHPAGTTFCLQPGTYWMTAYVIPKNNDRFIGQPGTVLDGSKVLSGFSPSGSNWVIGGQTQQNPANGPAWCTGTYLGCGYADDVYRDDQPLWRVMSLAEVGPGKFYFDYAGDKIYVGDNPAGHKLEAAVATVAFKGWQTGIDGVILQGLTVQKFANEAATGAINGRDGWVIENCEARLTHSVGVNGGTVRNNYLHHNGQYGLSGTSLLVEGNEISFNNTPGGFDAGDSGGTKFVFTTHMTVRNNYVHDNNGAGLWTDGNNIYVTYEGNRVENNAGPGIDHEIGFDAIIRNNTLKNNSTGWSTGQSIWHGANLFLNDSQNVEIYGNTIEGDANGIGLVDIDRSGGGDGLVKLSNVYIHDNIISMRGGQTGAVGRPENVTPSSVRFVHNTYHVTGTASPFWQWNADKTWAQWQAVPQDNTGSADSTFPPGTASCDVNGDNATSIADVQLAVNQALGLAACSSDLNGDGKCSVVDVQRVVNAVLGGACNTNPQFRGEITAGIS